eukprot:gene36011-46788_t
MVQRDWGKVNKKGPSDDNKITKPFIKLDEREGARSLTSTEKKAKDIFDKDAHIEVTRAHTPESRVPLSSLQVGQKLSGRIITVTNFGMFIDVGTLKDGLVHVKDISKDYFIESIDSKFKPGQDIDVWVKFVEKYKLGLQLFPVQTDLTIANSIIKLASLKSGQEISGTVMRVSSFGVYVDIGTEVQAFLHRRKMKISRKQRKLQPWEIVPAGSKITGFVYECDPLRKRVEITTYLPDEWDVSLPPKTERSTTFQGDMDDDEEMGGSSRAENFRALQRTLEMTLEDENDDEEGEDLDISLFDRSTSSLSSSSSASDSSSTKGLQVIMDDFGGQKGKQLSTSSSLSSDNNNEMEEMSVEEIFEELCNGKTHVTLKDIRGWEFITDLMTNGELDEDGLQELCKTAGSKQGKLNQAAFDNFMDLLTDELDMEIIDEDGNVIEDQVEAEESDNTTDKEIKNKNTMNSNSPQSSKKDTAVLFMDDFATTPQDKHTNQLNDNNANSNSNTNGNVVNEGNGGLLDVEDLGFGMNGVSIGSGPISFNPEVEVEVEDKDITLPEHFEKKSKSNDLLQYLFKSVAGKKKVVTLEDVIDWEFVRALMGQIALDKKSVMDMFNKSGPRKGSLDIKGFEKLLELLSNYESAAESLVASSSSTTSKDKNSMTTPMMIMTGDGDDNNDNDEQQTSLLSMDSIVVNTNDSDEDIDNEDNMDKDDNEEDDEDDWEEIDLFEAFTELAKGKDYVTIEDASNWPVINELIEQESLSTEDFKEVCKQAGAKRGRLDYDAFEEVLEILSPLADEEDDNDQLRDEDDEDTEEDEEEIVLIKPSSQSLSLSQIQSQIPTQINPIDINKSSKNTDTNNNEDNNEDSNADEEDEVDEVALLGNVFKGISGGKQRASIKDLMNWDFILDLISEEKLNEKSLTDEVLACG